MRSNEKRQKKEKNLAENYKKLIRILIMLGIFVLISLLSTLLLYLFGIIYFDDGIQINKDLFAQFSTSWYGCIIIVIAQVIITSLLSFVPGASMAFIMLLQSLYENAVVAFIVAFSGVLLSSLMMYLIGRFGGYNLGKKIIGEEDCEKACELLNNKGLIYFPLMMMFPVFPDDALVMVAGTLKMSLKWFVPSIVFGRGIGVATIVFGLSIVPFDKFTSIWHWIIFIAICAVGLAAIFLLANKFNKYLENKNKSKETKEKTLESKEEVCEKASEELNLNNKNAQVLLDEERYADGGNSPTRRIEYRCPCGKGKIVDERVVGFDDYSLSIECDECKSNYDIVTGQGYIWELRRK